MIDLLNNDLKNEYKHMLFYLNSSIIVVGLHREEFREYFLDHAKSEMEHITEFGRLILGLGGIPTTESNKFESFSNIDKILDYALKMEMEVVENYVKRIEQARELGGVDGKYIELFLEEQILDSRKDVDNLRQLII